MCCLQQAMLPTGAFAMFGIGPTGLSKTARRAPKPQPPYRGGPIVDLRRSECLFWAADHSRCKWMTP
jgi:hypothetical protein